MGTVPLYHIPLRYIEEYSPDVIGPFTRMVQESDYDARAAEVWAYKHMVPHTEVCREGWCDRDCLHAKAARATTPGGGEK